MSLSQCVDAKACRESEVLSRDPPGHQQSYSQWPGTQSCRDIKGAMAGSLQCVDSCQEGWALEGQWNTNQGPGADQSTGNRGVQVEVASRTLSPDQVGAVRSLGTTYSGSVAGLAQPQTDAITAHVTNPTAREPLPFAVCLPHHLLKSSTVAPCKERMPERIRSITAEHVLKAKFGTERQYVGNWHSPSPWLLAFLCTHLHTFELLEQQNISSFHLLDRYTYPCICFHCSPKLNDSES